MKDKLINHAIRQGYANALRADQFAAYVLFIDIDADQVDVNVHPAKHEVRFHQARWVHDFIYQSVADVLRQCLDCQFRLSCRLSQMSLRLCLKFQMPLVQPQCLALMLRLTMERPRAWILLGKERHADASPSAKAQSNYGNLLSPTPERQLGEISRQYEPDEIEVIQRESLSTQFLGKPLSVVASTYLLMQQQTELVLMDLNYAAYLVLLGQLQCGEKGRRFKLILYLSPLC